jgi:ribose transport system substrate-binding protein
MAWLDRDRSPAMFAIATSVASSSISFVLGNALLTGISKNMLFLWTAAVFAVVGLVSWTSIRAVRGSRRRAQRAFMIVSAFDQKYYVASFVRQLHDAMDRDNIDLVLKVPDRDYDAGAASHHIERVLDRKDDYLGGVIFAGAVYRLHDDLLTFCRKSRLPVVFTDLEPFTEDEYPDNSVFVGYDTAQLGRQAGLWLVNHLRDVHCPRVLVIASREHSRRQDECARVLDQELKGVLVTVNRDCEFIRSRAHDAVLAYVRGLDTGQCLDAIFCTNDEMGLGAVDALAAAPSPATRSTVVIGVDCVAEAKALIDSGSSPFRASVVQNAHELALSIVARLVKMNRGGQVPKRTILEASVYEARQRVAPVAPSRTS